jgi:hypothetical protein
VEKLRYIHRNPVERGLVARPVGAPREARDLNYTTVALGPHTRLAGRVP